MTVYTARCSLRWNPPFAPDAQPVTGVVAKGSGGTAQKHTGGKKMSLSKTSFGRAALLAGVSVIVAGYAVSSRAFAADTVVTVPAGQVLASDNEPVVDASPSAGDTFTINNSGIIRGSDPSYNRQDVIGGDGSGAVIIHNDGLVRGRLDFSSATGPITFTNSFGGADFSSGDSGQGWIFRGDSYLGSAGDVIDNSGLIHVGGTLDFGAGNNTLQNRSGGRFYSDHNIYFGDGNNTLDNGGQFNEGFDNGDIAFGAGNDLLVNEGSGSFGSYSMEFGEGNNTFRTGGTGHVDVTTFGSGDDVIENDGGVFWVNYVDFGAGSDALNVTAGTFIVNTINFRSGDDSMRVDKDSALVVNDPGVFDFGDGNDTLTNAGHFIIDGYGSKFAAHAGSLTITGLETFNNSGLILMGSDSAKALSLNPATDGQPNDVLHLVDVNFKASDGSRIAMDALLGGTPQADCANLTAADCVEFVGGSVSGTTLLTINNAAQADQAGFNSGITLIVGANQADNFVLDPNSKGYVAHTSNGQALQNGLIDYYLVYDATAKKHMLVGGLADEPFQASTFSASAQEIWRDTAADWFYRQADLRETPGGLKSSNGLWFRGAAASSQRDLNVDYTHGSQTMSYDVGHKQRTGQAIMGMDVLHANSGDSALVAGGMIGFVRSDVSYKASPTDVTYSGFTGGVYGSYMAGPFFVDGLFNADVLKMEVDAKNLGLPPANKLIRDIHSLGGQLEAGWKFPVGPVSVEPLAGFSYVNTSLGRLDIQGGRGSFDFGTDYKSIRAGVGARISLASELMGAHANYSLTARYWNESKGRNLTNVVLADDVTIIPLIDNVNGGYTDVTGSMNLFSSNGGVSGFVNLGGKFGSNYHAVDGSFGVRLRW